LTHCSTEKFVKKVLGENDIEAVLQRLDRLTLEEARAAGAQTLEVVHGLVQHRRVVMDGENTTPVRHTLSTEGSSFIPIELDDKALADHLRKSLGRFVDENQGTF
jgi:hypothetical protein